ncbi:MAG TPA: hypothetical protein VMH49_00440 [Thermoplasmata archaeon]|nr:hypothetical protein [Thermoplasmata archaeon]
MSPSRPRPSGPSALPSPPKPTFAEPPAYRAHPLAPPGACVNCGSALGHGYAMPRCWECGRGLCPDCYWRHGLTPAEHRCAGCAARGAPPPSFSVSGGRTASP